MTMIVTDELEQWLREALAGLHDPDYRPAAGLCAWLKYDGGDATLAVQAKLLGAIERLRPSPDLPVPSHARQAYDLLHSRFVLGLTQEETSQRLHMSLSTVNRAQRNAIYLLAQTLWSPQAGESTVWPAPPVQPGSAELPGAASDWRSQADRELAALQTHAPDASCDVGEVIAGLLELVGAAGPGLGMSLQVQSVQPGLIGAVHPVALRQTLLTAARELARSTLGGRLALYARLEHGAVKIALTGRLADSAQFVARDLAASVLTPQAVTIKAETEASHVFLWIELPAVGAVTVVVVDDNPDMIRFYRRSAERTRYRIVPVEREGDLFEAVRTCRPAAIVLDVMLPEVDGWRLLMRLHADDASRDIPVIICSVVKEEMLALSLGAARYLPKPVSPAAFTQALDAVLTQV
jgi:CheY-like chemotaxis protein